MEWEKRVDIRQVWGEASSEGAQTKLQAGVRVGRETANRISGGKRWKEKGFNGYVGGMPHGGIRRHEVARQARQKADVDESIQKELGEG